VNIRTYRPGDEAARVAIYNEAAADLPKFKPATLDETTRRCRATDFDAGSLFLAEEGGRPVGYASFHANGRVSYPWCAKGFEGAADSLFQHVLQEMRQRGLGLAFAAYRGDWPVQQAFFVERGFQQAREMINFVLDLHEMTTRIVKASFAFSSLRPDDVPAVYHLAPEALRVKSAAELERSLCHNPYFTANAVFVLRTQKEGSPVAAGILIQNPAYADPKQVDPAMPCFRLGAFGTEGMQTKRIKGLFSFLARDDASLTMFGSATLDHAACQFERTGAPTMAAQVPSDAPYLVRFYQEHRFRRQGSFPVLELAL
jgi:GNAT superfamily N-acetyltransferase